MPYTNIMRMCLSGLGRIPGQIIGRTHLMGQCQNLAPSSRLVTVRWSGALKHLIAITRSQRDGPKKTKKEEDNDFNKPKRPQSAFFIWFMENREKIKEDNPSFSVIDIAKKAGELWKEVTPGEKKPYETLAAILEEECRETMEEYNETLKEEGLSEDNGSKKEGKFKPKKSKSIDNSPMKSLSDSKAAAGRSYKSKEFISDSESSGRVHSDDDDEEEEKPIKHNLLCTNPCLINVSNTQINRYSVANEEIQKSKLGEKHRRKVLQNILEGGVPTLEPQIVTCLPEKFTRTGNETFVTCGSFDIGKFPDIELFTITASSGSENFHRVCKTTQELPELVASHTGMVYNENSGQVLRDGKSVELTGPKEALQQFIHFLKKQNNPVLVTYDGYYLMGCISVLLNKWGLLDDFISEVPYYLIANECVNKYIQKGDGDYIKLATIYEKLTGLKFEQGDEIKRVDALYRFFTEHLQQHFHEDMPIHTNHFYTRNSLSKKFVDGQIYRKTINKLSKAGIGLDHLNFLAEKGLNEFVSCLVDRGISNDIAERLYSVFQRNEKKGM